MRKLFVVTGGISNDCVSFFISLFRPFKLSTSINTQKGVLNFSSNEEVKSVCKTIRDKGFYIFDLKLSEEYIEDLTNLAMNINCFARSSNNSIKVKIGSQEKFDYPRYDFNTNELLGNKTICNLVTDQSLKVLAGEYLGSTPICDLITMWWSFPSDQYHSEAAQIYHFDMDRFKFLKFFFYLTDVDEETGPHCYVESSHRRLPFRVRRDGRFSDKIIEEVYGKHNIKKLIGPKGTIMAVDTRGFHKGEPLIHGRRLLFQIEFSNSLFGMNYPLLVKKNIHPEYLIKFEQDRDTYLKIFNKV